MTTLNKIAGGLLGVAVGDALGATTEFMTVPDIKKKYNAQHREIVGGGWLNLKAGEVTDDTQMTLCIADAIIECEKIRQSKTGEVYLKTLEKTIGRNFLKWYRSNPKDVGKTVSLALVSYKSSWSKAAQRAHFLMNDQSAGNGTLMRTLPVVLAYDDARIMEQVTVMQSKMTHYDDLASEACLIYNRIAQRLLNQTEGFTLKQQIKELVTGTRYESILKRDPEGDPYAYVVNTFLWVLRALYKTNSFEDALVILANRGHDSDTTCAIAGGLAGIYYGLEGIPTRWTDKIIDLEKILDTAEALLEIREGR